jgi:hypothetical protein
MNFAAETSLGVVTVRAFNMVDRFYKNYLKLVDTDASLFFHSNVAMEWVVLRIEALQNLTVITAALLLILLPRGYVSPGIKHIFASANIMYFAFSPYTNFILVSAKFVQIEIGFCYTCLIFILVLI